MRSSDLSRRLLACALSMSVATQAEPCDPAVPPLPNFFTKSSVEAQLFADERAARGTCTFGRVNSDWRDSAIELAEKTTESDSASLSCNGVCEAMRPKLEPLGREHDLEDLTFQKECQLATSKLPANERERCHRVCVAERRFIAAPAIFARTLRALEATLLQRSTPPLKLSEVRKSLTSSGYGAPPSSISLSEVTDAKGTKHVRAEGWVFPGGPHLRLETTQVGAGCGHSMWGIAPW